MNVRQKSLSFKDVKILNYINKFKDEQEAVCFKHLQRKFKLDDDVLLVKLEMYLNLNYIYDVDMNDARFENVSFYDSLSLKYSRFYRNPNYINDYERHIDDIKRNVFWYLAGLVSGILTTIVFPFLWHLIF